MAEREMFGYRWRYEDDKLFKMDKRSKKWSCCNELKPQPDGYVAVGVGGRMMYLHRLVYYFHHPEWYIADTSRDNSIDHVNQDKSDNRIENLRVVNNSQNLQNVSTIGGRPIRGVYFMRDGRKKPWRAHWYQDCKLRTKHFATEEEALACRREMVKRHYTHAPA